VIRQRREADSVKQDVRSPLAIVIQLLVLTADSQAELKKSSPAFQNLPDSFH
jgi:hypothetical protein